MTNNFQFDEKYNTPATTSSKKAGDSFGIHKLLLKYNFTESSKQAKQISIIVMLGIIILSAIIIFATNVDDSIPEEMYYDPSADLVDD